MDLRVEAQASTPRRLWAFVRSLPPDSAWARQGKAWTTEHELAAVAIERADYWGQLATEGRFKRPISKLPPIEHRDREAVSAPSSGEKRMSTREEISGFLRRVTGR